MVDSSTFSVLYFPIFSHYNKMHITNFLSTSLMAILDFTVSALFYHIWNQMESWSNNLSRNLFFTIGAIRFLHYLYGWMMAGLRLNATKSPCWVSNTNYHRWSRMGNISLHIEHTWLCLYLITHLSRRWTCLVKDCKRVQRWPKQSLCMTYLQPFDGFVSLHHTSVACNI